MTRKFLAFSIVLGTVGCAQRSVHTPATQEAAEKGQRYPAAIPSAVDTRQRNRDWVRVKGPTIAHINGKPLFLVIRFDPQYDNIIPIVVKREEGSKYRLVALDENGERIPLSPVGTFGTDAATLGLLSLRSHVEMKGNVRLTVEVLTPEAQGYLAHQAYEQARSKGIYLLPPPEGGKPYDFTLKTTDGNLVHSSELKGTATLIECWQVECPPCVSFIKDKMGNLARKYSKDLSIISVNLKDEPSVADAKLRELLGEVPAGLRHVCAAPDERESWSQSLGNEAVPYFLIIDKEGRLHPEYGLIAGEEVTEIVEQLLGH